MLARGNEKIMSANFKRIVKVFLFFHPFTAYYEFLQLSCFDTAQNGSTLSQQLILSLQAIFAADHAILLGQKLQENNFKKLASVFHASTLLLMMNFVISSKHS